MQMGLWLLATCKQSEALPCCIGVDLGEWQASCTVGCSKQTYAKTTRVPSMHVVTHVGMESQQHEWGKQAGLKTGTSIQQLRDAVYHSKQQESA